MFAPSAFELQPSDVALVEDLHATGWHTGASRDHDALRTIIGGAVTYEQRYLTPAQYRALKRLEQCRAADERAASVVLLRDAEGNTIGTCAVHDDHVTATITDERAAALLNAGQRQAVSVGYVVEGDQRQAVSVDVLKERAP